MNLKWVADHFDKLQVLFVGMVLVFAWLGVKNKNQGSSFKVREANRDDLNQLKYIQSDLANSKLSKFNQSGAPLSLPGINLNGEPHEVLGISIQANETEIMRAYKDKIKQFHPDRVQGQALQQIKFYEDASSKINSAKEKMLSKIKK